MSVDRSAFVDGWPMYRNARATYRTILRSVSKSAELFTETNCTVQSAAALTRTSLPVTRPWITIGARRIDAIAIEIDRQI